MRVEERFACFGRLWNIGRVLYGNTGGERSSKRIRAILDRRQRPASVRDGKSVIDFGCRHSGKQGEDHTHDLRADRNTLAGCRHL